MLEIEQKYSDADFAALERRLAEWQAHTFEEHEEEDQYLAAPDRDFRVTGEAFRMRRVGKAAFFTYKGPKLKTEAKIRTELELPLPDGDGMAEQYLQLFHHLGYRPVAVVKKRRRQYPLTRQGFAMNVCLDEVEGIGRFAEVEILAEKEQMEKAESVLLETAAALGLKNVERRSYLALVLGQDEPQGQGQAMTPTVATIEEIRRAVAEARAAGRRIALVPTMGALHDGHLSLIRAARQESGFVVVSLFVNPAQFGPNEDLARYPRPFEQDWAVCTRERVDLIFAPPVEVVYPPGYHTYVEVQELQDVLEGAMRPGHFRGVCTVVLKLFNMVGPDVAFFGQKDAQQVILLRQMIRDLNVSVTMRVCPTVREADGLALSSRNQYLSPEDRSRATVLIRALHQGRDLILAGERNAEVVCAAMNAIVFAMPGATLDYAAVVDAESLGSLTRIEGKVLLALAVRLGSTRLIDNLLFAVSGNQAQELPC